MNVYFITIARDFIVPSANRSQASIAQLVQDFRKQKVIARYSVANANDA